MSFFAHWTCFFCVSLLCIYYLLNAVMAVAFDLSSPMGIFIQKKQKSNRNHDFFFFEHEVKIRDDIHNLQKN